MHLWLGTQLPCCTAAQLWSAAPLHDTAMLPSGSSQCTSSNLNIPSPLHDTPSSILVASSAQAAFMTMLIFGQSHLHAQALLHHAESSAQAAFSILPVGNPLWWAFQPLPELLNGADHVVRQVRLAAVLFVAESGLLLDLSCLMAAWTHSLECWTLKYAGPSYNAGLLDLSDAVLRLPSISPRLWHPCESFTVCQCGPVLDSPLIACLPAQCSVLCGLVSSPQCLPLRTTAAPAIGLQADTPFAC